MTLTVVLLTISCASRVKHSPWVSTGIPANSTLDSCLRLTFEVNVKEKQKEYPLAFIESNAYVYLRGCLNDLSTDKDQLSVSICFNSRKGFLSSMSDVKIEELNFVDWKTIQDSIISKVQYND